jgi:hypothetical protein
VASEETALPLVGTGGRVPAIGPRGPSSVGSAVVRPWRSRVGVLVLVGTMGLGLVGIPSPVAAAHNDPIGSTNPSPAKRASQRLCGTYAASYTARGDGALWTCTGWSAGDVAQVAARNAALGAVCGGVSVSVGSSDFPSTFDTRCESP